MKFVISDLHLMDRQHAFLFNSKKELVFSRLCKVIQESKGELILAGDVFDLTGLTPCERGTHEFFREAVPESLFDPATVGRRCIARSHQEMLIAIRQAFPSFFESLATLARQGRLTYIPGNHDCAFLQAQGRESFAKVLGVSGDSIRWCNKVETEHLLVGHGNEFDRSNRTEHGCRNPGFVFTSALYQAVIPALHMLGIDENVLEAIPAVRPEEETIMGLSRYLGEEGIQRVLVAFARLLQRNGYFQGISRLPAWFLSHDFPLLSRAIQARITVERIRALLPKEEKLEGDARRGAELLREKCGPEKIIVLGHTHELDLQEKYVNLGTWIDHLTGLHPTEIRNPQTEIPIFVMDDSGKAKVYDGTNLQERIEDCEVLWRSY